MLKHLPSILYHITTQQKNNNWKFRDEVFTAGSSSFVVPPKHYMSNEAVLLAGLTFSENSSLEVRASD